MQFKSVICANLIPSSSSCRGLCGDSGRELLGETFLLGPILCIVGFGVSFELLEIGADHLFAAVSALERNRLCQLPPSIFRRWEAF